MNVELLTANEVAKQARISRRTLDKRIKAGTGPAVLRMGCKVLVRSDALEAWLERLTVQQHVKAA